MESGRDVMIYWDLASASNIPCNGLFEKNVIVCEDSWQRSRTI